MIRSHRFRALALGAGLAVAATACSGSGGSKAAPTTTTAPAERLTTKTAFVNVVSVDGEHALSPADQRALVNAVGAYVRAATLRPLKGQANPGLASLFVPAAQASLQGPEAATIADTGLPRATKVDAKLEPVSLHGLADASGTIDLVGSTIDLTVNAQTKAGPITIHRTGQLMFERDSGTWKILGYQLAVTRDGAGLGAASSSSSTTKAQS